jgi:hypothetical protein
MQDARGSLSSALIIPEAVLNRIPPLQKMVSTYIKRALLIVRTSPVSQPAITSTIMLPLIALSLLTTALAQTVPVTIINQCATAVQPQILGTNNGIANPATLAPGGTVSLNIYEGFTGFIAASTGDGSSVYGGASLIYVNLNVSLSVQCAHIVLTSSLVRKLLARTSQTPDAIRLYLTPF